MKIFWELALLLPSYNVTYSVGSTGMYVNLLFFFLNKHHIMKYGGMMGKYGGIISMLGGGQ
jgi:hypothetical protein